MSTHDLVYVGFLKRVAALHRDTGEIVWEWEADKGSSYLTLLVDRDLVLVSVDGYMYGLDAATGNQRWSNPMRGFGTGVASLATQNTCAQNSTAAASATAQQMLHTGAFTPPHTS